MKKGIKRVLSFMLVLICVLALIAAFVSSYIRPVVIKQVGDQLNVPVKIKSFDASFFTHFPYFSLTLNDLDIPEYPKRLNKDLVQAQHFDVLFNPFDLLNQDYTIKKVMIRKGVINLTDDNFNVFKTSSGDDPNGNNMLIQFSSVELKKVEFNYFESNSKPLVKLDIQKLESAININKNILHYNVKAVTNIEMEELSEYQFLTDEHIKVEGDGSVDINKSILKLNRTDLAVLDQNLSINGEINWLRDVHYDVVVTGNEFDAGLVTKLSPQVDWKHIGNPKFSRKVNLKAIVKDKSGKPQIELTANSNRLGIVIGELEEKIEAENVSFDLKWTNSGSLVSFDIGNLEYDNHSSKVAFTYNDENKAQFSLNIEKSVPLALIRSFVPEVELKGHLETEGILLDMAEDDIGRFLITDLAANVDLNGVTIGDGASKITINKGKLMSSGINIDGVRIKATIGQENPFVTEGNVELSNVNYLLYEGVAAKLKGEVNIQNYAIQALNNSTSEVDSSRDYLRDLTIHLQLQLDSCTLDKIKIKRSKSLVQYEEGLLAVTGLDLQAFGGKLKGNFNQRLKKNQTELKGQATFNNIDMNRLFYELNDFDQNELTHQNIYGTAKGDVSFNAFWINDSFASEKLKAVCNISIEEGKLVEYETLIELSEFVNVEELSNVEFKTLKNTITIDSGNIYIPKMSVFNTALSMDVSGVHRLDNYCNYQVEISVVEVLAKRAGWARKRKEKRYNEEQNGGLTAYISMVGDVDDLQISYDKKRLKKKIKADIKKETKEFSDALKGRKKEEEIEWDE